MSEKKEWQWEGEDEGRYASIYDERGVPVVVATGHTRKSDKSLIKAAPLFMEAVQEYFESDEVLERKFPPKMYEAIEKMIEIREMLERNQDA